MEISKDKFNRLVATGKINIDNRGRMQASESLFSDEEMLTTISDKKDRQNAETALKVHQSEMDGTSIFIPGNVPSSKNSYKIVHLPGKTVCCKSTFETYPGAKKGLVLCDKCKKVTPRMMVASLALKPHVYEYKKNSASFWTSYQNLFSQLTKDLPRPIFLGFYFIRDSKRRFDYINAMQILQDIMVKGIHNTQKKMLSPPWIIDDDADNIKALPLGYHVDKEKAGVIIKVLPPEINELLNQYL